MTQDREAIANKEIGHTAITRSTALFVSVAFLSIIVCATFSDLFFRVRTSESSLIPPATSASVQAGPLKQLRHRNGRLLSQITAYENQLNQDSPITRWFVPAVQKLFYSLLGFGNEKVYVGKDDWLFYRPGMDYLMKPSFLALRMLESRRRAGAEWQEEVTPNPIPAILEFQRELNALGIELLVVPTPTKAMLYGAQFSKGKTASEQVLNNPGYAEFVRTLTRAGVHVIPLHDHLAAHRETPLYLKTDSHWTPTGMMLAADAITAQIHQVAPSLQADSSVRYKTSTASVATRGDLAVMLRINGSDVSINRESTLITQVLNKNGASWRPDKNAPVLLLGDSFSNIYSLGAMNWGSSAGLAEHISYRLHQPIDAIRINDNGSFATRAYLSKLQQQGKNRLTGKKVVIYQFAIRELSSGNWKTGLPLKPAASKPPHAGASLHHVTGKVAAVKTLSVNDSSTYRDCLIPVVLTDMKTNGASPGAGQSKDIIVYVWGMLNGKLTQHNQIRPGETITFDLTPFEDAEDQVGGFRRLDFTDAKHLLQDTYLGDQRLPNGAAPSGKEPVARPTSLRTRPITQRNIDSEPPLSRQFLDTVSSILNRTPGPVYQGESGWMYLRQELSHLNKGTFFGAAATAVSESENKDAADPLPAILDFQRQLTERNISLLLVPVPPKAVVYPEGLDVRFANMKERMDTYHQEFYKLLREKGVAVLDLTDAFIAAKENDGEQMFCTQDSHWSGAACRLAATEISSQIAPLLKGAAVPHKKYTQQKQPVTIEGDLWQKWGDPSLSKETIDLFAVSEKGAADAENTWKESPVLLIGDSHTLVFHTGGDLHFNNAGLPDQLAVALGFPVDLMGIRGSGTTMARVSLLRRKDSLTGKKVVVWCFTARDFTESTSGFALVPVSR